MKQISIDPRRDPKPGHYGDPLVGSMVGVADRIRSQRDPRAEGSCGGVAGGWGN